MGFQNDIVVIANVKLAALVKKAYEDPSVLDFLKHEVEDAGSAVSGIADDLGYVTNNLMGNYESGNPRGTDPGVLAFLSSQMSDVGNLIGEGVSSIGDDAGAVFRNLRGDYVPSRYQGVTNNPSNTGPSYKIYSGNIVNKPMARDYANSLTPLEKEIPLGTPVTPDTFGPSESGLTLRPSYSSAFLTDIDRRERDLEFQRELVEYNRSMAEQSRKLMEAAANQT